MGDYNGHIDRGVFVASVVVVLGLVAPLALFPDQGRELLGAGFDFLTHNFGVVYIIAGIFALGFLVYLGASRHGEIRFSRAGDEPRFGKASWAAMLFCGGIGSSVLYWGTVEWMHYFNNPPFGLASQSDAALVWAVSYPIFHWGLIGWAFYCLPGIAMGYMFYVVGVPSLRLSSACESVIPQSWHKLTNPLIDIIFVIGLVGACSTGIGLGVPLISALTAELLGLDAEALGFGLDFTVIVVITALFSLSAWLGLEKGIKRLSNFNALLAVVLLAFVFLVGPTLFILELGLQTIGHLIENFIQMSFWTDPQRSANFVESWTIFYWAWWLALGPFMGLFIAKISRGRTIREIVFGCLGWGTLGCAVFFVVLGNYAVNLQVSDGLDVLAMLDVSGAPQTIVAILKTMPMAPLVLLIFLVLCVVFVATSYDSASYTLATAVTTELPEEVDPTRSMRIFWAILLGILPITLVYMGGLRPLQSAVTLASVPLLVVMFLMSYALWRALQQGGVVQRVTSRKTQMENISPETVRS
ncbi:MAG: BCCT family transporter [Pseudomonadota bacterium]